MTWTQERRVALMNEIKSLVKREQTETQSPTYNAILAWFERQRGVRENTLRQLVRILVNTHELILGTSDGVEWLRVPSEAERTKPMIEAVSMKDKQAQLGDSG